MKNRESGFTIVELLIVIVIIAILAALVIVAYTGITARANTVKAQTNAVAVQKKAEAYAADNGGNYPTTTAMFAADPTSVLPPSITLIVGSATAVTSATSSQILYKVCGTNAGYRITYWDFSTLAESANIILNGSAASCGDIAS